MKYFLYILCIKRRPIMKNKSLTFIDFSQSLERLSATKGVNTKNLALDTLEKIKNVKTNEENEDALVQTTLNDDEVSSCSLEEEGGEEIIIDNTGIRVRGNDNDLGLVFALAYLLSQLDAIHFRHPQVCHHQ